MGPQVFEDLFQPAERERLTRLAQEVGLEPVWDRITGSLLPACAMILREGVSDRPGQSRLGGVPDLPPSWTWPVSTRDEGRYLSFIGQINLAETPAADPVAPMHGILYFFIGQDEPAFDVEHRVLLWDGDGRTLVRAEAPGEDAFCIDADDGPLFSPSAVAFFPTATLGELPPDDPSLDDFSDQMYELSKRLASVAPDVRERSQWLGSVDRMRDDPRMDAYLARHGRTAIMYLKGWTLEDLAEKIETARQEEPERVPYWENQVRPALQWYHAHRQHHWRESKNWQVLLEVDSHRQLGMCWWDAGQLQFLIDRRDLQRADFSHTYACIDSP